MNGLSINSMETVRTKTINTVGEQLGFNNLSGYKSQDWGTMKSEAFDRSMRAWTGDKLEWSKEEFVELKKQAKTKDFLIQTSKIIGTDGHKSLIIENLSEWEKLFKTWTQLETTKTGLSKKYTTDDEFKNMDIKDLEKIHIALGGKPENAPKTYDEFKRTEYK